MLSPRTLIRQALTLIEQAILLHESERLVWIYGQPSGLIRYFQIGLIEQVLPLIAQAELDPSRCPGSCF